LAGGEAASIKCCYEKIALAFAMGVWFPYHSRSGPMPLRSISCLSEGELLMEQAQLSFAAVGRRQIWVGAAGPWARHGSAEPPAIFRLEQNVSGGQFTNSGRCCGVMVVKRDSIHPITVACAI
jgi:hypothetical protein